MTTHTSKMTVTFKRPFLLGGLEEILPAGAYDVETDEVLLEGLSFPAYQRVLTVLRLPISHGQSGLARSVTIDPVELEAALKRDQVPPGENTCGDNV